MKSNPALKTQSPALDLSPLTIGNRIMWKPSGPKKGRGIYAITDFKAGEVIEQSPVTILSKAEVDLVAGGVNGEDSILFQYVFEWTPEVKGREYCMGHGYLMLYNHSKTPCAVTKQDFDMMTISMVADRDIAAGEEITFNYDCEIWFDIIS